jgi:poly(beta-D-mannuronate) lyase
MRHPMTVHARKSLMAGCALLALAALPFAALASASHSLKPPFDVEAVRQKVGKKDQRPFTCAAPPAAMKDLHMESFYEKDGTFSNINKEAHAAYKKAMKPASTFEVKLTYMANRYVKSNPPRADFAKCDLDWLANWAQGDALLGDVNKNGEYTRKWLLGSIASSWMQIRDEPSLDPAKRKIVTDWIRRVAEKAKADFSRDTHLKSRQNNHLYWAAWGVGAAGLALDDREFFDWGVEKAREGIGHIQKDGTLPLEVARGKKAYLYHMFAAMPLFMLANAAEKNGIDLFRENDGALKRLGALCLQNLGDPEYFEEITDIDQDLTRVGTSSDLGWVEIYRQHYADPAADAALRKFRPVKHSRFGGNITLLYGQMLVDPPGKDGAAKKAEQEKEKEKSKG